MANALSRQGRMIRVSDYRREGPLSRRDVRGNASSKAEKVGSWVSMYAKVISKAVDDGTQEGGLEHTLAFYGKKNGPAMGSGLNLSANVSSLYILSCPRNLSYHPRTDRVILHTDMDEALIGQVYSCTEINAPI